MSVVHVTGRFYRLRRPPTVGDVGGPSAAGLSGHSGHAGRQPQLVPEPGAI